MDMERVHREKFCDNNARVLRAINTLRTKYVRIRVSWNTVWRSM